MRISSFISFVGFVMIAVATFCPILHFAIFNQTVYQLNQPYGILFLLIAIVGILGSALSNQKLTRLAAWISLGLTVLFFIAAMLKINTSFSFIPFHSLSAYLSSKVKFRWGWYLLCVGAVLSVAGVFANKTNNFQERI